MGFIAGISQLKKLRQLWPKQQLEGSPTTAVPVFRWLSSPGQPRSPPGAGIWPRPGACRAVMEPGRSGLQPQLHHLCLPKQHRGYEELKKKNQKALSGARGTRVFLSLYSILLHVLSLLRPCGFGAAPQRLPVIRIPWIAAAFLLPAGLSLTAAPAPRPGLP